MAGRPKRRAERAAEAAARAEAEGAANGEDETKNLPAVLTSRDIARITPLRRGNGQRQIPYTPDLTDDELDEALRNFREDAEKTIDVECEPVAEGEEFKPTFKEHPKGKPWRQPERIITAEERERVLDLISENASIKMVREITGVNRHQLYKLLQNDPEFAQGYADAKKHAAHFSASEIIRIADEAVGQDAAGVQAAKLRIEARKWIAAKLMPREYGEQLNMKVEAVVATISDKDLEAQIRSLIGVTQQAKADDSEGESG